MFNKRTKKNLLRCISKTEDKIDLYMVDVDLKSTDNIKWLESIKHAIGEDILLKETGIDLKIEGFKNGESLKMIEGYVPGVEIMDRFKEYFEGAEAIRFLFQANATLEKNKRGAIINYR